MVFPPPGSPTVLKPSAITASITPWLTPDRSPLTSARSYPVASTQHWNWLARLPCPTHSQRSQLEVRYDEPQPGEQEPEHWCRVQHVNCRGERQHQAERKSRQCFVPCMDAYASTRPYQA
jgi:hypothetical protein